MEFTSSFVMEAISREFPGAVLAAAEPYGLLTLEIKKDALKKVIHHLKDSSLGFTYLTDICGIHHPEMPEKELGVIYHLHNMIQGFRLRLKCYMPLPNAEVDTVTDLFAGANWMERETFEFYGIKFRGHPDLRVILNEPDIGYFPMLKQYPLEDGTRLDKDDTMFGR